MPASFLRYKCVMVLAPPGCATASARLAAAAIVANALVARRPVRPIPTSPFRSLVRVDGRTELVQTPCSGPGPGPCGRGPVGLPVVAGQVRGGCVRNGHRGLLVVPFVWQAARAPAVNGVRWRLWEIPFPMVWQMAGVVV